MRYGMLCNIEEQLNKQGYTLGNNKELIDKIHFELNIYHIYSILSDSKYRKAFEKLNKEIGKITVEIDEVTES